MLETVGAVAVGLKSTVDLAQSVLDLVGSGKGREQALKLYGQIVAAHQGALMAQAAQADLLQEKDRLETRIAEFETWDREKQRYKLKELVVGVFAYVLKPEAQGADPPHEICPNCYERRQKRILQRRQTDGARGAELVCAECRIELKIVGLGVRPVPGEPPPLENAPLPPPIIKTDYDPSAWPAT